ncbi:hypothetical protein [Micromonospora sp. NBC_00617]|uniref:hypothetical protein n=1 Tax=Micromonospora sp. NBC_00617 TaxID=2903587 RepID=UPI0030E22416
MFCQRSLTAVAIFALGLAALIAPTGPAVASPGGSGAAVGGFAAEARKAGLTGAEAAQLQSRVDQRLAQAGGRQVAANKIEYGSGSYLLLNLPGEKYARELGQSIGTQATCTYLYFCAWGGPNYTLEKRAESRCSRLITMPWSGTGSWINNQTQLTQAAFLRADYSVYTYTLGAYSAQPYQNWQPIYYVDPC